MKISPTTANRTVEKDAVSASAVGLNLQHQTPLTGPGSTAHTALMAAPKSHTPSPPNRKSRAKTHQTLEVLGIAPIVGPFADATNAALYTAEGNYKGAAAAIASFVPIVGDVGTGAKLGAKAVKATKPTPPHIKGEQVVIRQAELKYGQGNVKSQAVYKDGKMLANGYRPSGSTSADTTVLSPNKPPTLIEVKTYGDNSLSQLPSLLRKQAETRHLQTPPGSVQQLVIFPKTGTVTVGQLDRLIKNIPKSNPYIKAEDIQVLYKPTKSGINGYLK